MIVRTALIRWLTVVADAILRKYRPIVVGITGSVGKTSTKEAIATVLQSSFSVWKNQKNYNNEIGVPLSIIGAESGYRSPFRWFVVFFRAFFLLIVRSRSYPQILVLELGADRPGDIASLTQLVSCQIGVLTAVAPVHTEFFGTVEKVLEEKSVLVTRLGADRVAVLNADDALVMSLRPRIKARILSFGFSSQSDIQASDVQISNGERPGAVPKGLSFKVKNGGTVVPVFLPGVIGQHQALAAMAAIAVGHALGLHLVTCANALRNFRPPPGRMVLLPGIKNTLLVDDTYNASPTSTLAALETLQSLPNVQGRLVCLGDMAELGDYSQTGHEKVGEQVALGKYDLLVTVGHLGRIIAQRAKQRGMPENQVFSFATANQAGRFLQDRLQPSDVVLVKGSQMVRMEKIVKELMAEPQRAAELLVRQDPHWLRQ